MDREFLLQEDKDRFEVEDLLHDGLYDFDDIKYDAKTRELHFQVADFYNKYHLKWKWRILPCLRVTKESLSQCHVRFLGVDKWHLADLAQIGQGDITTIRCLTNGILISGMFPVKLSISLDSPYRVIVCRNDEKKGYRKPSTENGPV